MLDEMREQGAKVYDGEAAIALRAIEQGARDARKAPHDSDDGVSGAHRAAASGRRRTEAAAARPPRRAR